MVPSSPPAVVQAPQSTRGAPAHRRAERATPPVAKPKARGKPTRVGKVKGAVSPAQPVLKHEEASSPDGALLTAGLALFMLVLAATALLVLSTRELRGPRSS